MSNKLLKVSFFALMIIMLSFCAAGADYSFRVPTAQVTLEIESDGTMTVFYEYVFENLGDKLDFVDIGLPNSTYSLGDVVVMLNGETVTDIKVTKASYQETGLRHGISLEMGKHSVPKGQTATVSVVIPNLRDNLNPATSETNDGEEIEFAGFQYSPNYFSSRFTVGTTNYSFILVFPPGVGDGDAYYYPPEKWPGDDEPASWLDEDGCVVYEWYSENANVHTAYTFGGKFISSALSSTVNIVSSTGGSSSSGSSSEESDWFAVIGVLVCLTPVVILFFVIRGLIRRLKSGKGARGSTNYFPPQVKTDGEGIKRGLTAVEAAVLLEVDLERVISMILYGLAKKEVIRVTSQEPLEVEIADPLPDDLHEYEKNFIAALREKDQKQQKTKLRDTMHRLILSVSRAVEGFSLKETKEYYQSICEKAWAQVEAADTPELKSQLLGDNFGWTMLDEDAAGKYQTTFNDYDMTPPIWWWRVDPMYRRPVHRPMPSSDGSSHSSGSSGESKRSGSGSSTSKSTPMPVLPGAMFARSITDSARRLGASLTGGNMNRFASSVKNRTNPTPVSSVSSSSHRHGGGGSSCACACACHSCACACAGGGR